MRFKKERIAIVGAGFSGAVIAHQLAAAGISRVVVFEERAHVAGNCHTSRDEETGAMVHRYGPHIFHTFRSEVWEYVQRFCRLMPYTNRVKAVTSRGVFSLPLNLLTINQFFGKRFSPSEAARFLADLADKSISEPKNFQEQALAFVGRELYECFFRGYTRKQWGVDPTELPAAVLKRLPIRFDYDDNYYRDPWQGIPLDGYTELVNRMLDHRAIDVQLFTRATAALRDEFDHVFWSGPIDAYFEHELGHLRYRTLDFEWVRGDGDYQGNAVINYCEESVPFTRVTEHKHLSPWEHHARTLCSREYSRNKEPGDIPFYPLGLEQDQALLLRYRQRAAKETGVTFVGRLGTYRYLDMDACISESLRVAAEFLAHDPADGPFCASVGR